MRPSRTNKADYALELPFEDVQGMRSGCSDTVKQRLLVQYIALLFSFTAKGNSGDTSSPTSESRNTGSVAG